MRGSVRYETHILIGTLILISSAFREKQANMFECCFLDVCFWTIWYCAFRSSGSWPCHLCRPRNSSSTPCRGVSSSTESEHDQDLVSSVYSFGGWLFVLRMEWLNFLLSGPPSEILNPFGQKAHLSSSLVPSQLVQPFPLSQHVGHNSV